MHVKCSLKHRDISDVVLTRFTTNKTSKSYHLVTLNDKLLLRTDWGPGVVGLWWNTCPSGRGSCVQSPELQNKTDLRQVCCYGPVIPVLQRLGPEDHKFRAT